MTILESALKTLGYISLLFGLFTIITTPPGILGGVVWLPKLWAGAWAPILALMGLVGALCGLASKDYWSLLAGMLGVALGIQYTILVTRPPVTR